MCAKYNVDAFRKTFSFATKDLTRYYPGHMHKGLKQLQSKLPLVDLILEVHDGRIPFSGRNPHFTSVIKVRPHILVLNKIDLADLSHKAVIEEKLRQQGVDKILYTNCKDSVHHTIKHEIVPLVTEMVDSSPRYHRSGEDHYNLLVIGVPNTGKSTLINSMRRLNLGRGRSKAAAVGGVAGITRSVMERIKISDKPPIYVLDSPGILTPQAQTVEEATKLAVCACMKDSLVGEELIADYLLFWLNQHRKFEYVDFYNLPCATDTILELLAFIAKQNNSTQKRRNFDGTGYTVLPNFARAAQIFLQDFRKGRLGKVLLDQNKIMTVDGEVYPDLQQPSHPNPQMLI